MKYVKTTFYDESYDFEISADSDGCELILISIDNDDPEKEGAKIHLNIETAVKFSKDLRRKIADAKSYNEKNKNNG